MPSHAEKNQTEIKNYYRIIDPEERLSENEKAEEERRVLANMPACFPAALRYVMKRSGFTQEALAFESKVSESTIGRYRNGKVENFSEKNVVALCVAMHLPPCDLETFFRYERQQEEASVQQLLDWHRKLTDALQYAVDSNWLKANPVKTVDPCLDNSPVLFNDFLMDWLKMMKSRVAIMTYANYEIVITRRR